MGHSNIGLHRVILELYGVIVGLYWVIVGLCWVILGLHRGYIQCISCFMGLGFKS